MKKVIEFKNGILLVLVITLVSVYLGRKVPALGAAGLGILLGIAIISFISLNESFSLGINFVAKHVLHLSIVFLGASINIKDVIHTGFTSLPIILTGLAASFLTANIVGKLFNLNFSTRNLIGAGTGICGGSAIAALSSVIKSDDKEISYSLSTIFLFNIFAVFSFPFIGHVFHMSQEAFGLFAGSAINDTSSVVAAAYTFGNDAGKYATTVKLARTMMIIPIIVIFTMIFSSRNKGREKINITKLFPWFISGFLIMSLFNTILNYYGTNPEINFYSYIQQILAIFSETGKFLIVMAITAIGLKTNVKTIIRAGVKPLLLGFITWMAVIFATLIIQLI